MRLAILICAVVAVTSCAAARTGPTPAPTPAPTPTPPKVLPGGPAPIAIAGDDAAAVERVLRAQVDAYNRRDLDAFMSVFARNARMYTFPGKLMFSGRDAIRAVYAKLFARATALRSEVTHRIIQGAFVIDREITTGIPGEKPHTGVAIYEVRGGLITRVWFLE